MSQKSTQFQILQSTSFQTLINKLEESAQTCQQITAYLQTKRYRQINHKSQFYYQKQPQILKGGQLLPHQLQSLNWMISLYELKKSGILADDMGLGKTIQAISFLAFMKQKKKDNGPHLIILPKSTMLNFHKQCNKWLPQFRTVVVPGNNPYRMQVIQKYIYRQRFDILILTYESMIMNIGIYKKILWSVIVVDEAHKIKNIETQKSINIRYFNSKFKLLMTGTPLSIRIKQLWSMLNLIVPQYFKDDKPFDQIFNIIQKMKKQQRLIKKIELSRLYQKILKPFMLRRTKKEISLNLPQKKERCIYVGMTKLQLKLYRKYLLGQGQKNNITMQLRKICSHPYNFKQCRKQKGIGEHLIKVSGKMIVLDKLIKKLINDNHKIVIFSQFLLTLNVLQELMDFREIEYYKLDGSTNFQDRFQFIEQFNKQDSMKKIFLMSTKAGSLGINLTGADTVILYDSDWNPMVDLQATQRVYRIGQKKQVHVYTLIIENSIQERIYQIQKQRLVWDQLVIQKGRLFTQKENKQINFNENERFHSSKQIFKANFKTFTDENIEALIARGKQKQQKLQFIVKQNIQKKMDQVQNFNDYFLNTQKQQYDQLYISEIQRKMLRKQLDNQEEDISQEQTISRTHSLQNMQSKVQQNKTSVKKKKQANYVKLLKKQKEMMLVKTNKKTKMSQQQFSHFLQNVKFNN